MSSPLRVSGKIAADIFFSERSAAMGAAAQLTKVVPSSAKLAVRQCPAASRAVWCVMLRGWLQRCSEACP